MAKNRQSKMKVERKHEAYHMQGQALVESLFTYMLIFLLSFCVIEVARLQSFKVLLQISTNYYAKYIALDEMRFIKENKFNLNSRNKTSNSAVENEIQKLIANDLSYLETSLFSFDEKTIKLTKHNVFVSIDFLAQETSQSPPGIHIKAQTCLPVLFSSFLNNLFSENKTHIGHSINDVNRNRNCLGEFLKTNKDGFQSPRFWFRVRAAGYSPWPSATQIFYKGLAVPEKMNLIDTDLRKKFIQKLDEENFEEFF